VLPSSSPAASRTRGTRYSIDDTASDAVRRCPFEIQRAIIFQFYSITRIESNQSENEFIQFTPAAVFTWIRRKRSLLLFQWDTIVYISPRKNAGSATEERYFRN